MVKPSITIFIDPSDKSTECFFVAQEVTPAEYGVVISGLMKHIARQYCQSYPDAKESDVITEIKAGIDAGIEQSQISPIKFN